MEHLFQVTIRHSLTGHLVQRIGHPMHNIRQLESIEKGVSTNLGDEYETSIEPVEQEAIQ